VKPSRTFPPTLTTTALGRSNLEPRKQAEALTEAGATADAEFQK